MPILNNELMRATILTHYENPYHKETPQNADEFMQIHLTSTGCIDNLTLYLKIENDKVMTGYFDGFGCTISIASTSILLEMIEGMKTEDVLKIIEEYKKMLNSEPFDEEILNEAIVFANTVRQPSRIGCASISWDGVRDLINEHNKEESKNE